MTAPVLPHPDTTVACAGLDVGWLASDVRDLVSADTVDDAESRRLYAALGEVPALVVEAVVHDGGDGQAAGEVAGAAGLLQGLLRSHVRDTASARFGSVQEVLEAFCRDAGPNELTASCAAALCEAGGFDRALLSRVEGSSWTPGVLHVQGLGPVLTGGQVALVSGLPETELVRKRAPQLVEVGDHNWSGHPMSGAGVRSAYVAAALVADGRVIGLLHADNQSSGRPLTRLDRDVVQLFAAGFTRAYERASLLERVVRQREQIRETLSTPSAASATLDPSAVRFARSGTAAGPRPRLVPVAEAHEDGQLTAREHEILSLLATGATNLEIADRLVVSESTVKSHVKRILRKLPAANRAEAVYVYLRMTGAEDRSA